MHKGHPQGTCCTALSPFTLYKVEKGVRVRVDYVMDLGVTPERPKPTLRVHIVGEHYLSYPCMSGGAYLPSAGPETLTLTLDRTLHSIN